MKKQFKNITILGLAILLATITALTVKKDKTFSDLTMNEIIEIIDEEANEFVNENGYSDVTKKYVMTEMKNAILNNMEEHEVRYEFTLDNHHYSELVHAK